MHGVDPGVPDEVPAHVGAAVDHPQEAGVDERREGPFDEGTGPLVDRVDLEQADLALVEQLVSTSMGAMLDTLPAPSTRQTAPSGSCSA